MEGKVLVLGATGAFGGAVARVLVRRGVRVRALVIDFDRARRVYGDAEGIELVRGDALDRNDVTAAAEGCGWIVHAVGFPLDKWTPLHERSAENILAAARVKAASILFPGNVCGLGRQTSAPLTEGAPNQPCSRKGVLRTRVEEMLMSAALEGQARVLILRAGDYYGPTVRNPYHNLIFGRAAAGRAIRVIGSVAVPHQWAFIHDLGRAAVDLMELGERFLPFEIVNFPGYVARPQGAFIRMVAEQAGLPSMKVALESWARVRLTGLFNPIVREIVEMRYLFDEAVILDGAKFHGLLPSFADTPVTESIRQTLDGYRRKE